uniref:Uncharacterized protein n=1 Tax=Crocodylus porosus TaxID=8502 RepID=A0A7M4FX45_CROPO
ISPFKMDIDIECQQLSGSRWTELVSSMKDCKAIGLDNCNLTGACCEILRSVLSAKPSLTDLHLGRNKLETSGGKVLCQGLLDPNCKVQSLM